MKTEKSVFGKEPVPPAESAHVTSQRLLHLIAVRYRKGGALSFDSLPSVPWQCSRWWWPTCRIWRWIHGAMKVRSAHENPTTLRDRSCRNARAVSVRARVHLSCNGEPNVVLNTLVRHPRLNHGDGIRTLCTKQINCDFGPTIIA